MQYIAPAALTKSAYKFGFILGIARQMVGWMLKSLCNRAGNAPSHCIFSNSGTPNMVRTRWLCLLLVSAQGLSSCYMDVGPEKGWTGSVSSSSKTPPSDGATAADTSDMIAVGHLSAKLFAGYFALVIYLILRDEGYDPVESAIIAVAFYELVAPALTLSVPPVNAGDPVAVAPYVIQGALAKLDKTTVLTLSDADKEALTLKFISGLFAELNSSDFRTLAVTDDQRRFAMGALLLGTINALKSVSYTDMVAFLPTVFSSAFAAIDDAYGAAIEKYPAAAKEIFATASKRLFELKAAGTPWDSSLFSALAKQATLGLATAGVSTAVNLNAISEEVSAGIVEGLTAAGAGETLIADVSSASSAGILEAMSESGYNAEDLEAAKAKISASASQAMVKSGVSQTRIDTAKSDLEKALGAIKGTP